MELFAPCCDGLVCGGTPLINPSCRKPDGKTFQKVKQYYQFKSIYIHVSLIDFFWNFHYNFLVPEDGHKSSGISLGMENDAGQEARLIVVKMVSFGYTWIQ